MANTMTGRILSIGNVETIPSKTGGEPFKKRVVVLNCTRMDFGKTFENYPSFEFSGKNVDVPLDFKVDEIVTISFVVQGIRYQKDNQPEKFFNTVSGYKIEHYRRGQPQQMKQDSPQAVLETSHSAQSASKFPPSVDSSGNPIVGDSDDLPF